jgi:3'(2'), 5'-bisphosphate nucleotidase
MASLDRELELALDLARDCGKIALHYHRGDREKLEAEEKDDARGGGLVTRADTEIDAALVSEIRNRFPNDAVLAEESVEDSDRNQRDRCWMIDPIDGTKEFASRDPSWAIHIGLCIEGRPVLGVVAQPAAHRVSWGVTQGPDAGAWTMNDAGDKSPLRVSTRAIDRLRMVSSKSHSSPRTLKVLELLSIDDDDHLRTGSTGVKISMIARDEADVYVHPTRGTKLWDSCAPEALLVAAGGRLTNVFGQLLPYTDAEVENTRGLLATHGTLHDEIVDRIAADAAEWFPGV